MGTELLGPFPVSSGPLTFGLLRHPDSQGWKAVFGLSLCLSHSRCLPSSS